MCKKVGSILLTLMMLFSFVNSFQLTDSYALQNTRVLYYMDDVNISNEQYYVWLDDFNNGWTDSMKTDASTWNSSNENVVKIKEGYGNSAAISVVGVGESTISVKGYNQSRTATKTIRVQQNYLGAPTQNPIEVGCSESVELFPSYASFNTLNWRPLNSYSTYVKFTGKNGRWYVEGLREGTSTEEFLYYDGNESHIMLVKFCVVGFRIRDFNIPGTIEVEAGKPKAIPIDGKTDYVGNGSHIAYKIQWNSSNTDVATVSGGQITAKKGGTTTITATLGNYSHTCEVNVIGGEWQLIVPESVTVTLGSRTSLHKLGIYAIANGKKVLFSDENVVPRLSKNNIVELSYEDEEESEGYVVLHGCKKGSTTATIKCKYTDPVSREEFEDSKSFKVVCKYQTKLKTEASLYDIKRGTFYFNLSNYTGKTITVYSSGAKSKDVDYKAFDCKLKLSKGSKTTLKAGKSKTIKFKVIKGKPWQNPKQETIYFKIKWNGKKYNAMADYDTMWIKSGKKWKIVSI